MKYKVFWHLAIDYRALSLPLHQKRLSIFGSKVKSKRGLANKKNSYGD